MRDLIWLSEAQMRRIEPHFPLSHGVPRVDERRIISGIIFVIRNGLLAAKYGALAYDRCAHNLHVGHRYRRRPSSSGCKSMRTAEICGFFDPTEPRPEVNRKSCRKSCRNSGCAGLVC
jgi:transposase